ncbi:MAG: hypothetical protein M3N23_12205, partial [Pseudomonadota bacterium]|nr:hypothetical protein [Pseudomonadota bacterium]
FDAARSAAVGAGGHFVAAASGPARLARVASSALGLFVLNLCMMIPALIYSILLCTGLIVSLAIYGSGIVLTSAGAAGVDGLTFGIPHHYLMVDRDEQIDGTDDHALEGVNEVRIGSGELRFIDHRPGQADAVTVGHSKIPGLSWVGTASRPAQVAGGVALVLTGILMLLAWLLAAKYSIIAVRQYVGLNIAALRAN